MDKLKNARDNLKKSKSGGGVLKCQNMELVQVSDGIAVFVDMKEREEEENKKKAEGEAQRTRGGDAKMENMNELFNYNKQERENRLG